MTNALTLPAHIRFTLAHNTWAIERLLTECERLTPEQFDRDLGIGPGSLRLNIAHTVEVMLFFADTLAGRTYTQPPDLQSLSATVPGLRTILARAHAALAASLAHAADRGIPDPIPWPSAPRAEMPAAAALAQVFDHAIAHRAQCVNMLKRHGLAAPDLDPMTFAESGGWDRARQEALPPPASA